MKFSDIQLTDKATWQNYQQAWEDGEFNTVVSTELSPKKLNAEVLNYITNKIVEVESLNDPDYANDRIRVEAQVPPDLSVGEVYFEWTNAPSYTWTQIDAKSLTFADIDTLGITWEYADRKGW